MSWFKKKRYESFCAIPDWEFDIENAEVQSIIFDANNEVALISYFYGDDLMEFEVSSTIDQYEAKLIRFRKKLGLSNANLV